MQCALKEWLADPRRLLGEGEVRLVEYDGRDVPHRSSFHRVDEFAVHGPVANTVSNDIDSCANDRFGIIEVIDIGRHTQAVLVRFINYRGIYLWLVLGGQLLSGLIKPDLVQVCLTR